MFRRRRLSARGGPNLIGLLLFLVISGAGVFGAIKFLPQLAGNQFGKADRFNIVIAGPETKFLSLDLVQKSAVVLSVPSDLYIPEVAFGYGGYRISSVYPAGELDRRGGETIDLTLRDFIGVPMDGYIFLPFSTGSFQDMILSKDFLTAKSNLSLLERLQLVNTVFNLRQDKIRNIDLSKLTAPLVLADGSQAKSIEKAELDNYLSRDFFENSLRNENFRVEVINTTKIAGLGAKVSRLLSNIGMDVINVSDSGRALEKCQVEADPKVVNSKTVQRVVQIYGCSTVKSDLNNRADVSVLVGSEQ